MLSHAKEQVLATFNHLKAQRYERHMQYLQQLPCYTVYLKFMPNPPLSASQLNLLHERIGQAQAIYQAGIDEDWRRSCLKYPEILDYYFSLVEFSWPDDWEPVVKEPRFGVAVQEPRNRLKNRRESLDHGTSHRKRSRRRSSRDRTPPAAPMAGAYRR